ncbi:MAG: DNA mismatch repair endonuclease MutL [Planctomycetota bacterium]|nr:DNA mismatch repair endonuclease MutL [Planctomycetota bacterium]
MIRVLPPEVVNQIAAGEVVERPFSVVKELVENSLDAGATRVTVELRDGGRESIRISDDGGGFTPADLELAFVSHATSKLGSLADLDHIASLGFRGEALASIGSIARVTIRSRRADADEGFEITCEGGAIGPVRPCGCPPGTVIEVRDVFFNTPARRRFLRTARAERARIEDLLARLALARLDVDFTLVADDREVLRLPAGESLADRVGRAFGSALVEHLVEVEVRWDEYAARGLVGTPGAARRDATLSLLYVNGRFTKDRSTAMAVRQAYREFLMPGQQPVYFLELSLPPDEVDVNVHPTKSEVRFLQGRRACGILHEAVTSGLRQASAAPKRGGGAIAASPDKPRAQAGFPELPRDLFGAGGAQSLDPLPKSGAKLVDSSGPSAVRDAALAAQGGASTPSAAEPAAGHVAETGFDDGPFGGLQERRFLQVLDCYLVFETDDGMVVVDQHALHERVLYERFSKRHAARGAVPVQNLLVPEVLELAPSDKAWLLDQQEVLADEGLRIEDFGGRSIAIHGVPALLGRIAPRVLIETLLRADGEDEARPRAREIVAERFHSMACRAAIMSGDRLRETEIRELLAEARELDHPHNCPHGRPTVLTFSQEELERFFRRRVP